MFRLALLTHLRKDIRMHRLEPIKVRALHLSRMLANAKSSACEESSEDREKLTQTLDKMMKEVVSVPILIGEEPIYTGNEQYQLMPHNHQHVLAKYYYCNQQIVNRAMEKSLANAAMWANTKVEQRVDIWQKAADILENEDRYVLMAALMLGQAKTLRQAAEDVNLMIRQLRKTVKFLLQLKATKVDCGGTTKVECSFEIRPLDGFVAAISSYEMSYVAGQLALMPALMGNCVIWNPSSYSICANYIVYKLMEKAGLPSGVISFIPMNSRLFISTITDHRSMAGINYAGSQRGFSAICRNIATRLQHYECFPRLMAQCGGKNFHFIHETADVQKVAEDTVSSAFEYSGQNGRNCSRLYVPQSLWPELKSLMEDKIASLKLGNPCNFSIDNSALINENIFNRAVQLVKHAKQAKNIKLLAGGEYCKTLGYFMKPTMAECQDPLDRFMLEKVNAPLLAVYVYKNNAIDKALQLAANSSRFAFAGSLYVNDDTAKAQMLCALTRAAGNIYINSKSIGHKGGEVPFGGNRLSSTNDVHSMPCMLLRWSCPQRIEQPID